MTKQKDTKKLIDSMVQALRDGEINLTLAEQLSPDTIAALLMAAHNKQLVADLSRITNQMQKSANAISKASKEMSRNTRQLKQLSKMCFESAGYLLEAFDIYACDLRELAYQPPRNHQKDQSCNGGKQYLWD